VVALLYSAIAVIAFRRRAPHDATRLIDEAINKLRRADAAANELEVTILEAARARLVRRFVQSR
jgi:RNase adaptor protein for sRNA GlmZ degradation